MRNIPLKNWPTIRGHQKLTSWIGPRALPKAPPKIEMPRVICVSYSNNDVTQSRIPTDEHLLHAYHRMVRREWMTPKVFLNPGPERNCLFNAACVANKLGGKIRFGWLVIHSMKNPMSNRFSRSQLTAHAVWQSPESELVEVTKGYAGMPFIVDDALPDRSQVCMNFLDHGNMEVILASGFSLEPNVQHRLIRMW